MTNTAYEEIECLRKENAELRAVLERIAMLRNSNSSALAQSALDTMQALGPDAKRLQAELDAIKLALR